MQAAGILLLLECCRLQDEQPGSLASRLWVGQHDPFQGLTDVGRKGASAAAVDVDLSEESLQS